MKTPPSFAVPRFMFLPSFLTYLLSSFTPSVPFLSLFRFDPAWNCCYILQDDGDSSYPYRCFADFFGISFRCEM
jgi:hypothetical protein